MYIVHCAGDIHSTVRLCSIRHSHSNQQFPIASTNIQAFANLFRSFMRESHDQICQQSKQDDQIFSCHVFHSINFYQCCVNCFPVSPSIVLNNVISPVSSIPMAVWSTRFSWSYPLLHWYTYCFVSTNSTIISCWISSRGFANPQPDGCCFIYPISNKQVGQLSSKEKKWIIKWASGSSWTF